MSVVSRLPCGKIYSRVQKFVIPQNMKRGTICGFRFLLPPLPKCTQYGRRAISNICRAADAPKLIFIANSIYCCLFDGALT